MDAPDSALPDLSSTNPSAVFRAALDRHELRYQACTQCGHAQLPPGYACRRCGSEGLGWSIAAGLGVVHAVTLVGRAPSETFRPLVPYALILCALAEGPRIMGHGTQGLRIGESVRATYFQHHGCTLIRFVPA